MNKIINLPLWIKTIIISLIIHGIAISLIPGFIIDQTGELTVRDIKFFIEHILPSEGSSLGKDISLDELKDQIVTPLSEAKVNNPEGDCRETSRILTTDTGILSAQLGTVKDTHHRLTLKAEPQKKAQQLTIAEAQKILKQLEKEIALKEISSRGENKRIYSPRYLDQVRERIKAQYFVPDKARWEKMKGTVVLQVTVSARGEIKDIIFINHSDFPILDIAARVTVERAAPFPNIEKLVDLKELKFIVPIRY